MILHELCISPAPRSHRVPQHVARQCVLGKEPVQEGVCVGGGGGGAPGGGAPPDVGGGAPEPQDQHQVRDTNMAWGDTLMRGEIGH